MFVNTTDSRFALRTNSHYIYELLLASNKKNFLKRSKERKEIDVLTKRKFFELVTYKREKSETIF